jgi:hypothetical protein
MASLHPPADIESVKALLACGLSRAEIGNRLGMTRSAVSGLVFRMQHAAAVPPPRPKPVQHVRLAKKIAASEPATTAVPLLELADHACRWPVAGEGRATLFCGAHRGGRASYCLQHAARSVRIET